MECWKKWCKHNNQVVIAHFTVTTFYFILWLEVTRMVKKYKNKLTYDEMKILLLSLVELKNRLIAEGRHTDAVDELILKLWVE